MPLVYFDIVDVGRGTVLPGQQPVEVPDEGAARADAVKMASAMMVGVVGGDASMRTVAVVVRGPDDVVQYRVVITGEAVGG